MIDYKKIFPLLLLTIFSLEYSIAQEENNDAIWAQFQKLFWTSINDNWLDIHDSKRPEFDLLVYVSQDSTKSPAKHYMYMEEMNEKRQIKKVDYTDFQNQIEVDVRESPQDKSVLIYHISDDDVKEKIRLEYDFYVIHRLGFNKPAIEYDSMERYIESENVILNWNEDRSDLKVLIRNTTDYFDVKFISDKAKPEFKLSDYSDYKFDYPVVKEYEDGDKDNPIYYDSESIDFSLIDSELYGFWNYNGSENGFYLSPAGYCRNCEGDFWWAKETPDYTLIQVFDFDKDKQKPSAEYKAYKKGRKIEKI